MGLGALLAANIALWFAFGQSSLQRAVPDMTRADMKISRGQVPFECHPSIFRTPEETLKQDLRGCIKSKEISIQRRGLDPFNVEVRDTLRTILAEYQLRAHFEPESCPMLTWETKKGCMAFDYAVVWNTPILAEVSTTQFRGTGGSIRFVHWHIWCFGVWWPVLHRFAGME